jgi:hypothetical protein
LGLISKNEKKAQETAPFLLGLYHHPRILTSAFRGSIEKTKSCANPKRLCKALKIKSGGC